MLAPAPVIILAYRHLVLLFLALAVFPSVQGAIYITRPRHSDTCHGGQACTVAWLDDGNKPLLSSIGPCTIGLYTGNQQLVQRIEPMDVSRVHGFTFTPNPKAGPNSDTYYIGFTSTTLETDGPHPSPYLAFSPAFTIDNMQGSFDSPLASVTSSIAIPPTVSSAPPNTIAGTVTIGPPPNASPSSLPSPSSSPSSPSPSPSPSSSPSGFTTLVSTTSSPTPISSPTLSPSPSSTGSKSNAGHGAILFTPAAVVLLLFCNFYHY